MWEASSLPWAKLRNLEQQKEKILKFLYPVSGLTVLLIFDYFFITPGPDSLFTENILALVTIAGIVASTYGVSQYLKCELEIQKLQSSDVAAEQKRRNLEKSRELLKKAGIFNAPKVTKSFVSNDVCKPSYPYQRGFENTPVDLGQNLKFNLKNFEGADDLTEEFLKSLGVEKNIKRWIQNVKLWYSKQFLPLILENYSDNLTKLNCIIREYTQSRDRPWIYSGTFEDEGSQVSYEESTYYKRVSLKEIQDLAIEIGCNYAQDLEKSRLYSISGQKTMDVQQASQRINFIDLLKQRIIFEKYIDIPGFSCRGYVLQRIRALSRSSCLSAYSSISGGYFNSDSWTPKRPTDSHILSHLFFCLLNNGNNLSFNPEVNLFNEIVIQYPNTLPYTEQGNRVWFYQKNPESSIEPHYDVYSGGDIWQTYKGNDNLFCAIALFLHHIKTKSHGMFLQMNCNELLELIA